MEQQFLEMLKEGFGFLRELANLPFMACNMMWVIILAFTFKKARGKSSKTGFELFIQRIPKAWFVILQSIALAILWDYMFPIMIEVADPVNGVISEVKSNQFGPLFVSITFSMIIWKLGFHKIFTKKTK